VTRRVWITALLFMTAWAVSAWSTRRVVATVADARLHRLPSSLGGWSGRDFQFDPAVVSTLNADENVLRLYLRAPRDSVWLYIGYYGTNKGGRTGHMPQHCYRGAGYVIERQEKMWINGPEGQVRVNAIVARRGRERTAALYWTQDNARVMDSGWAMNAHRFFRRLREGRDDGAFVRLSAPVTDDPDAVLRREAEFASHLLLSLPFYWPTEA
jgi:EpsI family protein